MKKRWFLAALCLVLCLTASACADGAAQPGNGSGLAANGSEQGDAPDGEQTSQEKIFMDIADAVYPVTAEEIPYTVTNSTGETQQIVLAPLLERKEDGQWTSVDCIGGFCGTPDLLEETMEGTLPLEYYPNLIAGAYRLTFQLHEAEIDSVSAEFSLE